MVDILGRQNRSRSREGAWIEIHEAVSDAAEQKVAPVRERGLKCFDVTIIASVNVSLP